MFYEFSFLEVVMVKKFFEVWNVKVYGVVFLDVMYNVWGYSGG